MWKDPLKATDWSLADSEKLYGINNWGAGYFSVDANGDVATTPLGQEEGPSVSLHKIIKEVEERGLSMPVLLRIENILGSQIKLLHKSFNKAIKEFDYQGSYRGVYPIKVNQQEQVVEAITQFGKQYNHGLEAGSKPELIAAISMLENRDACLICNGYKDAEFIDLGLYATKMGFNCFFVIEMPSELELIIERAALMDVKPHLGLRVKLSAKAEGKWSGSGGDNSVFGLNMSQIIKVVDRLKEVKMLNCLELLHYHIGSQIPNIRNIREGVLEACRIYEGLIEEGAPMGFLDLGGGLAVDYNGSHSNIHASRNYSVDEYCQDIVETITTAFDKKSIEHPVIITESGRATVAYYSVLLFNVLDVSPFTPQPVPEDLPASTNDLLEHLMETLRSIRPARIQECYNDAIYYLGQVRQLFKHGQINLRIRAIAEDIFRHIQIKISQEASNLRHVPEEIRQIDKQISDFYYGNFSVFQSLPDMWAIDQFFPVMPIHRLNEQPTRPAIIADITCDCDGKIDNFVDFDQQRKTLPLHQLKDGEDYYLGAFLVGAYQETLGDLHNLFGDTNVVSINVDKNGEYTFVRELEGDSVADVLSYVEYDVKDIKKRVAGLTDNSIELGFINLQERRKIIKIFDEGLRGYTYFEQE